MNVKPKTQGHTQKQYKRRGTKLRGLKAALLFAGVSAAGGASAACEYGGVYYEHGTTICFDGWLQECTVADYWKAVGICRAEVVMRSTPIEEQLLRTNSSQRRAQQIIANVSTANIGENGLSHRL